MNDFNKLKEDIKNIKINRKELLSCVLDYSKVFQKDLSDLELVYFDKLFKESEFIEQCCDCVEESIVLAMQSVTLKESVDFKELVSFCIDRSKENDRLINISDLDVVKNISKDFFDELRSEFFSRTYSQNKDLRKFTKLNLDILNSRKSIFMEMVSK